MRDYLVGWFQTADPGDMASNDPHASQMLAGGLYSSLIIYPAALLAFAIVFWIVFAAMDPGSVQEGSRTGSIHDHALPARRHHAASL